MIIPILRGVTLFAAVFTSMLLYAPMAHPGHPDCPSDTAVDFRVVLEKPTYSPGGKLRLKLIITNADTEPLYLFRGVTLCSSQLGQFSIAILNEKGRDVAKPSCSADFLINTLDVVAMLRDSKTGIVLGKSEIYGMDESIVLPTMKGTYTVKVELLPPGLTTKQVEALSLAHMRVLKCPQRAPTMTIAVK